MGNSSKFKQTVKWSWLLMFVAVIALLGGSSRLDQVQVIALQPLSALFLIPAFYYLCADRLRQAKVLLTLLGLLALWVAMQLIPLPPGLWEHLPGREKITELDRAAGLEGLWRPIAMVPSRGLSALTGLIVPAVAILLAVALHSNARALLHLIFGLGIVDALLGVAQVVSGGIGGLYFYSITNLGSAVGIFANENHSGVFSSIAMLIAARLAVTVDKNSEPAWLRLVYPPAFMLFLIAALIGGSRTALLVSLVGLTASLAIVSLQHKNSGHRSKTSTRIERWLQRYRWPILLLSITMLVALLSLFFIFGRAEGLEEVFAKQSVDGLRLFLWPILFEMAANHWVWGIGFGSFEEVYHLSEPTDLLGPRYLNQAHNDVLQLAIEGGLVAIALVLAAVGWCAVSVYKVARRLENPAPYVVFWLTASAIITVSSMVDYPLRAPVFQLVLAWLMLSLPLERNTLWQEQ